MDMRIQECMKVKCMQAPGGYPESQTAPPPSRGHEGGGIGRGKIREKSHLKALFDFANTEREICDNYKCPFTFFCKNV